MASMSLSPIGLLFAAALSVSNVIGGVCNKKVVSRNEVVTSTFWIRLFAALELSIVLLVCAWRGSPPVLHAPAALMPGDLRDIPALAKQLKNPANEAVRRVADSLSETTRKRIADYRSGTGDAELSKSLREDLNGEHIIGGGLLYTPGDFAGVTLSAETRRVLGKEPRGEVQSYANRLLLEDLFPGAIARSQGCLLFGWKGVVVSPQAAFAVYLLIVVLLIATSQSLSNRALQVSPLSLCVPFTAFSPVFLVGTAYVVLGELPSIIKLMGICLIVTGGMLMHRKLFAVSWKAPLQAIVKEKGIRYILLSAFLLSVTSPIEKQLILMSDSLTVAFGYGIGTVIVFWLLSMARQADCVAVIRKTPGWAVLAGLVDAGIVLLQFTAVTHLPVVITICIKRAGIVLTILAGWLIFKEHPITDRLIAASAMLSGVAIFYLPLQMGQALTLTGLVVAGLALALYWTRNADSEDILAKERAEASART
jgi:drug/metabolite transporter (DMT)-like permease